MEKDHDRDIIERFVKACQINEGDIEKTGIMWSLTEVDTFIEEYFTPPDLRTNEEKLIDDLADIIRKSKEMHLIPVNEARYLLESFNITRI